MASAGYMRDAGAPTRLLLCVSVLPGTVKTRNVCRTLERKVLWGQKPIPDG